MDQEDQKYSIKKTRTTTSSETDKMFSISDTDSSGAVTAKDVIKDQLTVTIKKENDHELPTDPKYPHEDLGGSPEPPTRLPPNIKYIPGYAYLSPDSRFKLGDLVLVTMELPKQEGFPLIRWPGQIVHPAQCPQDTHTESLITYEEPMYAVYFFGTGDHEFEKESDLLVFNVKKMTNCVYKATEVDKTLIEIYLYLKQVCTGYTVLGRPLPRDLVARHTDWMKQIQTRVLKKGPPTSTRRLKSIGKR